MNLSEELYVWERLQNRYEEGSEERKKADREVFRLNKEIAKERETLEQGIADTEEERAKRRIELEEQYADRFKQINDQLQRDIDAANAKYDDALKSRADSIYSAYNLFDYARSGGNVEGQVLLDNIGSQVTAIEDWLSEIETLGGRGIAEGLLEELQSMGPTTMAEIKALNSLTDEQLNQYVDLWQQKHALAKSRAEFELTSLKEETLNTIADLTEQSKVELEYYQKMWDEELAKVNEAADKRLVELQAAFDEKVGTISSETRREVRRLTRDIKDAIDVSAAQIEDRVTDLTQNIQTAMETPDWVSIGTNIIAGIQKGIEDKIPELAVSAARAARAALEAAEEALDINSPSGEFAWVGEQCDKGLALGLRQYAGIVAKEARSLGGTALDAINQTIAKVSDAIENGFDITPTISPVLDLTNVVAGASQIDALFSRSLAASIDVEQGRNNVPENQNGVNAPSSGKQFVFTQNNYSPEALSRIDIYRQTKNQFSAFERMVNT